MQLSDLLSELRENMLHDRSDQMDGPTDRLWTDATLTRYINQAYFRFAREALCIRDGETPDYTQVVSRANVLMYPLNPVVLAVISAQIAGDTADLARAGHASLSTYQQPDTYFFDTSSLARLPPGRPRAYSTDEYLAQTPDGQTSAIALRLYPAPKDDGLQVNLRVLRLPSKPLALPTDTPELPETHHLEMLDWAAYLALRIVDHDAGDPARAQEFRASFDLAAKKARDLAMRKMFTPLAHGFGRSGWSWEGNGYGI